MSRSFTIRLALPPGWYVLGRDDPDAWMAQFTEETRAGLDDDVEAELDELLDTYGLVWVTGAVESVVHKPRGTSGVRAVLIGYASGRRSFLRRGIAAFAAPLARDLRRSGDGTVETTPVTLPSGPAVRLRAVATDELGRLREQVVHVVRPPRSPGAIVLRMQWQPGRPDADALAAMADRIAADALMEIW